jgi:integrase
MIRSPSSKLGLDADSIIHRGGTPIGVQQRLMRHADIRTTMNVYGTSATADLQQAHGKVVRLALS